MKKIIFFLCLLLLVSVAILMKPSSARAAVYTDMTCEEVAHEWDINRGKANCRLPSALGSIQPGGQQVPSQGGLIKSSSRFMGFTFVGEITGMCQSLCPEDQAAFLNNSALGTTSKLIASMYANPPASGVYYAYDLLHNAGLVKPAYAQGIGFSGLSPILPIWKAFRNISYVIIVIVLIAIGFMIMFRMKINPQTVISIQSALPNIVITLILITFSYAIAGLMIDLMYFAMSLVITIMLGSGFAGWENTPGDVSHLQQFYLNANLGTLFKAIVPQQTMTALPAAIFGSGWHLFEENVVGESGTLLSRIGNFFPALLATIVTGVSGFIGLLLIALTLLFSFVRIFIILLNSYIQVILAIILAPFQLLIGAIPGKSMFRNWLFGLIGNLAVFPTLVFIILVAGGFSNLAGKQVVGELPTDVSSNLWVAPFITGPRSSNPGLVTGLIALGFIILTPSLLNAVKGAFQAKPILPISPGIIMQPLTGAAGTATQALMARSYVASALQGFQGSEGQNIFARILGLGPKVPPKKTT